MISKDFVPLKKFVNRSTPPTFRRGLIDLRDQIVSLNARRRVLTGKLGPAPNFIIIGAQKSGTTQLYDEMIRYPSIASAAVKEVHFFDENFSQGMDWYRTFFPSNLENGVITGEASPSYLFHPHAPSRIYAQLPHVKVIALLRNPIARAYSHYQHEVRLGHETLSFEQAIEHEPRRLAGEYEKILAHEHYDSYSYMHHSYITRGIYVDQLQAWRKVLPKEQMLVLQSEAFYRNTNEVMEKVLNFLEVPFATLNRVKRHKSFPYEKIDPSTRAKLVAHFAPYNKRLATFLGEDYGWT